MGVKIMNKDMLVIRVSGILTDQRLEALQELFKAQLPDDQPFILIDESVEELDVLYGLNDGEESNNESVRDDIINNIVKQISDWRNNSLSKHRINGIDYGELNQIIKILHDYRFMSVSMFKDLTKVINEHKEYAERSGALPMLSDILTKHHKIQSKLREGDKVNVYCDGKFVECLVDSVDPSGFVAMSQVK